MGSANMVSFHVLLHLHRQPMAGVLLVVCRFPSLMHLLSLHKVSIIQGTLAILGATGES